MPKLKEHFDCASLVKAVYDQPLGLLIQTNHPAGFRRVLYIYLRKNRERPIHILQSPKSPLAALLVRADYQQKLKELEAA